MNIKRNLSRYALARRLHYLARQISAGKPVRIGSKLIHVPDHVIVEEELEIIPGKVELEFEIRCPSPAAAALRSPMKAAPVPGKRRTVRRLS
jgi:hypothetical protein